MRQLVDYFLAHVVKMGKHVRHILMHEVVYSIAFGYNSDSKAVGVLSFVSFLSRIHSC